LDAAAALLDREGFAALTTRRVAQLANCSIGAVYDYFADKQAIVLALLERYRTTLESRLAAAIAPDLPWPTQVDRGIDVFVDIYLNEPGYRALWLGSQLVDTLRDQGDQWGQSFSALVASVLALRFPGASAKQCQLGASLVVYLLSAAVTAALNGPEALQEATIAEGRWLIHAYLSQRFGDPNPPGRHGGRASAESSRAPRRKR
jgi:AcrR family transcriptional regulator